MCHRYFYKGKILQSHENGKKVWATDLLFWEVWELLDRVWFAGSGSEKITQKIKNHHILLFLNFKNEIIFEKSNLLSSSNCKTLKNILIFKTETSVCMMREKSLGNQIKVGNCSTGKALVLKIFKKSHKCYHLGLDCPAVPNS